MADTFLTFQEFETLEEAEQAGRILEDHNIPVVIEKPADLLDHVIVGRQYANNYLLRIPGDCFKEAQQHLIEDTKVELDKVAPDYPLLAMTNEELTDIMSKPDQWGPYNYNLARILLQQRQAPAYEQQAEGIRDTYLEGLAAPRELNGTWYFLGYSFSVISLAAAYFSHLTVLWLVYQLRLLPGLLGAVLGIIILTTRKTLPDGTRMLSYSRHARAHGLLMLLLSLAAFALAIARSFISNWQ